MSDGTPLRLTQSASIDVNDKAQGGDEDGVATTIEVDGECVKLDKLGPMIVNTDGTLSRIANWSALTEVERDRSLRLIAKRNKQRLAALQSLSLSN